MDPGPVFDNLLYPLIVYGIALFAVIFTICYCQLIDKIQQKKRQQTNVSVSLLNKERNTITRTE